jgi:hypothetical protein
VNPKLAKAIRGKDHRASLGYDPWRASLISELGQFCDLWTGLLDARALEAALQRIRGRRA